MTNRDFFITYCVRQDLCAIYRYMMMDLKSKFENKLLWERMEIYEEWLEQPINQKRWNEANDPKHRIPRRPPFDL